MVSPLATSEGGPVILSEIKTGLTLLESELRHTMASDPDYLPKYPSRAADIFIRYRNAREWFSDNINQAHHLAVSGINMLLRGEAGIDPLNLTHLEEFLKEGQRRYNYALTNKDWAIRTFGNPITIQSPYNPTMGQD